MKGIGGYTPKENATDIVLTLIRAAHDGRQIDFFDDKESPAFKAKVRAQLRKLHNRMLDQSGLDGLPIDEPMPKVTTVQRRQA